MSTSANPSPRRLLIVEDEPSLLASFQEYFESHGFAVSAASEPKSALDRLSRGEVDGVVSDIHLSSRHSADGLEIAYAGWKSGIPVLLVTGQPTDDLSNDPRLAKIAGLVRKPVSLASLHNLVDSMLRCAKPPVPAFDADDVRELLETYAPWLLASPGPPQS